MSGPRSEIRLSTELTRHIEKIQIDIVNNRSLSPILELHALGIDVSCALEQSFSRGFHEISKALLDARVHVTYQAEFNAAKRGVEAFAVLCSYKTPGAGALTSAVMRIDLNQVERIFSLGGRCSSSHYGAVPLRPDGAQLDAHQEMLHLMVAHTDPKDLTIEALQTIARYAKPVDLVKALQRSTVTDRSSLITHALCAGAEGNVEALRGEGLSVDAEQISHFAAESLRMMISGNTVSGVMTRLLELYRLDNAHPLAPHAAGAASHRLVQTCWKELIDCRYTDDVPTVNRVRAGLAALSACVLAEDRPTLTGYIEMWIDSYNLAVVPGVHPQDRTKLILECEKCFNAADAFAPTLDETACPTL